MPLRRNKQKTTTADIVLFGLLAGLIFASKKLMEGLPNIHLVGILLAAITAVYRSKALYPLYTYVLLEGLFGGFSLWWIPYLYVWTVLWGAIMLLPKQLPSKWEPMIYAFICGLHGLSFGILYAPTQALLFGWNLKRLLLWIAAGFSFDCIHGASNFILGLILIVPLKHLLQKLTPRVSAKDKT